MTPLPAKLVKVKSTKGDWEDIDELVWLLDWSSLAESFLIGRKDGTVEVRRVEDVVVNLKVQANMIAPVVSELRPVPHVGPRR